MPGKSLRFGLLFEQKPAAIMRPAHAREERHAEQIFFQSVVGHDDGTHVAHDDVVDLDHIDPYRRRAADAISGLRLHRIVALSRMNTQLCGGAGTQGHRAGTGIDDERQSPRIDASVDAKLAVTIALQNDRP